MPLFKFFAKHLKKYLTVARLPMSLGSMETVAYKKTQIGWVIIFALGLPLIVCLGVYALPGAANSETRNILPGVGIILAIALLLFPTLTVRVDATTLRAAFGIGLVFRSIPLEQIESVEIVRNRWWYGFGVRYIPSGGWMFNVSGLDALQLVLKSGKRFRIGTGDPRGLVAALQQQCDNETQ